MEALMEALRSFQERYGGRGYDSVEKLCQDPDVEVIWVSTPNQYHCEHTIMAANHGKHVVVVNGAVVPCPIT